MLLAASESAVTKKPRLRLMMRRSSSVSPLGSFQSDIAAHIHFLRHPVVGAGGEVLLPGPLVFERHQLVHVGLAVDDALVGRLHAAGRGGLADELGGRDRDAGDAVRRLRRRRQGRERLRGVGISGLQVFVPIQHGVLPIASNYRQCWSSSTRTGNCYLHQLRNLCCATTSKTEGATCIDK